MMKNIILVKPPKKKNLKWKIKMFDVLGIEIIKYMKRKSN